MQFTVGEIRVNYTTLRGIHCQRGDKSGLGQEAGGLSARHVEEAFAQACVALDAHASATQSCSTGQLK